MKKQQGQRLNLYLRLSGDDAVIREALDKMPRGSARRLLLAALHRLVPAGFEVGYGADKLAKDLLALIAADAPKVEPADPVDTQSSDDTDAEPIDPSADEGDGL